ncbi:hypothetical protein [Achromobacter sp. JUb104]|uniref:hypothetical protein n=1 Tax=Achromobacter sp. JUb104 TaxID=2940590 RepID=UPI002168FCFC|nr:hypothetical protein [Achromobacter sp. JUb104]MCS3505024.1 hypothetical protein [Achromobacter sp. JUb104]
MTSLITRHIGVNAPATAPVVAVSDLEVQVSRIPSLKAWWRADTMFNPAAGDGAWRDRVNDIPLTLRRAAWPVLTPGGQNGKSYLQFNAALGTILSTPADAALWPLGPSPWTFGWIGQPSGAAQAANEGVFGNEQGGGTGSLASAIFYVGTEDKTVWVREAGAAVVTAASGYPASGGPHFMLAARQPNANPAANRLKFYVDGVEAPTNAPGNPMNTNSRMLIGGNLSAAGSSVTNAAFGGRLYDLFVFHSVLTAEERAILAAYSESHYALPA